MNDVTKKALVETIATMEEMIGTESACTTNGLKLNLPHKAFKRTAKTEKKLTVPDFEDIGSQVLVSGDVSRGVFRNIDSYNIIVRLDLNVVRTPAQLLKSEQIKENILVLLRYFEYK